MKITIEIIDHSQQRYPTVGDWQFVDDELRIRVSRMSDWRREVLVGLHEAIEAVLAKHEGISETDVDDFDIEYEKNRPHDDLTSEPGDDPACPVYRQHQIATGIERLLAERLGVDWNSYSDEIESL